MMNQNGFAYFYEGHLHEKHPRRCSEKLKKYTTPNQKKLGQYGKRK